MLGHQVIIFFMLVPNLLLMFLQMLLLRTFLSESVDF